MSTHTSRVHSIGVGIALTIGAIGCGGGPGPVPGPLPNGCPPNAPPGTQAELERCVSALQFDTLEAAGDEQALTVIDNQRKGAPCPGRTDSLPSCRYGPLAMIQPEMLSHRLTFPQLQEGRIIAKLFLTQGQGEEYEKLALTPGSPTYWWVQVTEKTEYDLDRKHKQSEQPENKARKYYYGRSVFISAGAAAPGDSLRTKEYRLEYKKHPNRFKQALSRWVWDPDDEKAQGSCGQGCCR